MPIRDAQLIEEFKFIANKIKTEDVMEAALEMPCHYATVQRYLRGEVKKKTFGKKLLDLLKDKLAKRDDLRQP